MKKSLVALLLLASQNSFAISAEQLSECIYNNTNNVQTLFGLLQPLAKDEWVNAEVLHFDLAEDTVKTCLDVELILVDAYAEGLKTMKAEQENPQ